VRRLYNTQTEAGRRTLLCHYVRGYQVFSFHRSSTWAGSAAGFRKHLSHCGAIARSRSPLGEKRDHPCRSGYCPTSIKWEGEETPAVDCRRVPKRRRYLEERQAIWPWYLVLNHKVPVYGSAEGTTRRFAVGNQNRSI
jgi:hypothetical protein